MRPILRSGVGEVVFGFAGAACPESCSSSEAFAYTVTLPFDFFCGVAISAAAANPRGWREVTRRASTPSARSSVQNS